MKKVSAFVAAAILASHCICAQPGWAADTPPGAEGSEATGTRAELTQGSLTAYDLPAVTAKVAAQEFYRVLRPAGRAYVLHIDGRQKLNHLHDSHHAVQGDHLPCPTGMSIIFSEAGFTSVEASEGPDHYHFCAVKR